MTGAEDQLLRFIVGLPLGAGLAVLALQLGIAQLGGELPDSAWRGVGLGASLITFALALQLVGQFDPATPGLQFVEHRAWLADYGIHYTVGVDGLSLLLILVTTFLVPIALLASWRETRALRSFVFFHLMLESAALGALVSQNAILFYGFLELLAIPVALLIGVWGGAGRIRASQKFVLMTSAGSLLMLVALLIAGHLHAQQYGSATFDLVAGQGSGAATLFDTEIPVGAEAPWWTRQNWLFGAFALALALKIPLLPFHTWLSDAQAEAPPAASILLAGVVLPLGAYGLLRVALPLFPTAATGFATFAAGVGVAGALYGTLTALAQSDLKRLLSCALVAHLGLVILGIFALNEEGLQGSILQLLHVGLAAAALFLLAGMLEERRETRDLEAYGGLARPLPVFAAFLGIASMSSLGLPGLGGFVSEFLVLVGTFARSPWLGLAAALACVFAALLYVRVLRRILLGPCDDPSNRALLDLDLREKAIVTAVLFPLLWMGVYPSFFLTRIGPSVSELLHTVQTRVDAVDTAQVMRPDSALDEDSAGGPLP